MNTNGKGQVFDLPFFLLAFFLKKIGLLKKMYLCGYLRVARKRATGLGIYKKAF